MTPSRWQHFLTQIRNRSETVRKKRAGIFVDRAMMHLKHSVSSGLILHKAIDRYYRDAEVRGKKSPEHPISVPDQAVDLENRIVTLEGRNGRLATYAYTLTRTGYLRFRPEW